MSLRIASDDAPVRPGYVEIARGVSVPIEAMREPADWRRNIDGPLLSWAGQLHWLTYWERLALWLRFQSLDDIAAKRWPEYRRWHP